MVASPAAFLPFRAKRFILIFWFCFPPIFPPFAFLLSKATGPHVIDFFFKKSLFSRVRSAFPLLASVYRILVVSFWMCAMHDLFDGEFLFHRRGLTVCPVLEGEESLRLLNFQHNLIRKIENLSHLRKLIFLDLYDNQIEEIHGLSSLKSLRVLMLGKNRFVFTFYFLVCFWLQLKSVYPASQNIFVLGRRSGFAL